MGLIDKEDICNGDICDGIYCEECSFYQKDGVCLLRARVFKLKEVDAVPFDDYMKILTERNAAISDLAGKCEYCKYVKRDTNFDACHICCLSPAHKYWEWRGVDG